MPGFRTWQFSLLQIRIKYYSLITSLSFSVTICQTNKKHWVEYCVCVLKSFELKKPLWQLVCVLLLNKVCMCGRERGRHQSALISIHLISLPTTHIETPETNPLPERGWVIERWRDEGGEWERVSEHFLFIAHVPREEEDCCSKVLELHTILLCSAPAAAHKMKDWTRTINICHVNYIHCGW